LCDRRFQWHPSGSVLFVQTETSGVYNLWRVRVDPNTLAWVSAERLTTGAGADVLPALSRDGARLAFVTERAVSRLWAYSLDNETGRMGAGQPLTEDDAMAELGAISPDGASLAYNLKRPGSAEIELRIVKTAGGASTLLGMNGIGPVWSPDGKALLYGYYRLRDPIESRTAVRHLGGQERFLDDWRTNRLFSALQWTGNGVLGTVSDSTAEARLVFRADVEPDAPERTLISIPKAGIWQARWSPNGRWVSFVMMRTGHPGTLELIVAPAEHSSPDRPVRIAADHIWPDKPRWAPDGRTLYFVSRRSGPYFNLWAVSFDPDRGIPVGEPFTLSAFDSPSLHISPDVSRAEMDVSSRQVVLTMKAVSGSVWTLDAVDR
jgi:Tol biopolymer transport system component